MENYDTEIELSGIRRGLREIREGLQDMQQSFMENKAQKNAPDLLDSVRNQTYLRLHLTLLQLVINQQACGLQEGQQVPHKGADLLFH